MSSSDTNAGMGTGTGSGADTGTGADIGHGEIRAARRRLRGALWAVGLFSAVVNLLMLTGPVYMLQVYDRVLASRSVETLVALSLLAAGLFAAMGVLDFLRGRILVRVGLRFFDLLAPRVFDAAQRGAPPAARLALRDLEAMQRSLASPVTAACFDLPWTPVFLALLWLFHPWLGALAVAGGGVLIGFAALNQWFSRRQAGIAHVMGTQAMAMADTAQAHADVVRALGMQAALRARWLHAHHCAARAELGANDLGGAFAVAARTARMGLQSAMLGLGAYLVLTQGLSAGVMVAASILMGRALAPVEAVLTHWPVAQRALQGRARLAGLLAQVPVPAPPLDLGRPRAWLAVEGLCCRLPGPQGPMVLEGVHFALEPGQVLGVIGPSGAGKTALARCLTGVWAPHAGRVTLDGAPLDRHGAGLGRHVGYLPQQLSLMEGTIAENIARLQAGADPQAVIRAAGMAGVHDLILTLPQGYDTLLHMAAPRLSGGQVQRIGLARAFYGDPVLLVLDEPNAHLDGAGTQALNWAVATARDAGCAVVIMAHRPSAIEACDLILMLDGGRQRAFGPRDEVLRATLANYHDLHRPAAAGQAR